MTHVKYSIIVAAYNVEKYISKCLKSIFLQDYDNYEVIVIDDGSSDNTLEIARKFEIYDKFKIVNQSNMGTALARMAGVKLASGRYILFVDGDDYVSKKALSIVDTYVENSSADIYQFGYMRDYGFFTNECSVPDAMYTNILDDVSIMKSLFGGSSDKLKAHVTSKVYRRELLVAATDTITEYVIYGEDIYINLMIMLTGLVKKILSVDRTWYYYRQGIGAMSKLNLSLLKEYQSIRSIQYETISKYKLNEDYYRMIKRESMNILLHHSAMTISKMKYDEFIDELKIQMQSPYIQEALCYTLENKSYIGTEHFDSLAKQDYNKFYETCKEYLRDLGIIYRVKVVAFKLISSIVG